jgi:hypothetical protein
MTAHKYADILTAYAADTSIEIEGSNTNKQDWVRVSISAVTSLTEWKFRIKPKMRTVTANGKEYSWPEPLRVAPEDGEYIWHVTSEGPEFIYFPQASEWKQSAVAKGFCHLTKEAADQHFAALVAMNLGE